MVLLQKNRKTIKEYKEAYSLADDIKNIIPDYPDRCIIQIKQNAFFLAIHGAKMTLGNGYRIICE